MWSAERPRYRGFLERRRTIASLAVSYREEDTFEFGDIPTQLPTPPRQRRRRQRRFSENLSEWRNREGEMAQRGGIFWPVRRQLLFSTVWLAGEETFEPEYTLTQLPTRPRRTNSQRHRLFSKISREWIN